MRDFPGGPIIQNPPSNAGNVGSIPCQETKMPHAKGQLSPRTPQLGSSRAITKTPHRQKIKKNKKKNCFLKKKIESDEEFILKELTAGLIDQFTYAADPIISLLLASETPKAKDPTVLSRPQEEVQSCLPLTPPRTGLVSRRWGKHTSQGHQAG